MGWKDGAVVKSASCSSRYPKSPWLLTAVYDASPRESDFRRYSMHVLQRYTCRQGTHIHKIGVKKNITNS